MFNRQTSQLKKRLTIIACLLILFTFFFYPSIAYPISYYWVSVNTAANTGTSDANQTYNEISYDDKITLFSENTVAGVGYSAHANTSVNLATGAIKAEAEASGTGSAIAEARFMDTLTLSYPSGSGNLAVTVKWDVTGFISDGATGDAFSRFYFGDVSQTETQYLTSSSPEANFSKTVYLDPGDEFTYSIYGDITLSSVRNGSFDFYQTGQFSFIIPEEVIVTSESGVFLTQTEVIPLPGTLWLLGSGLLGLAGWRRFKKS